jgi:putative heme transporter
LSTPKIFDFSSPKVRQKAALITLWLAMALGLILVRKVILPFLLASLLAYVCHPLVAFIGKIKIKSHPIPRWLCVIIIYLLFAGLVFLLCMFFVPQFYLEMVRLAKDVTIFINSIDDNAINQFGQVIENFFRTYQLPLEIVAPALDGEKIAALPHKQNWVSIDLLKVSHDLLNDVLFYLKSEAKNIANSARYVFVNVIESLFMVLLILMITGFLLVDMEPIKKFAFSLVPASDQQRFDNFLMRLDQRLSGVVRGQLTICFVNAVLTLIGLLIFDVKFAFILATVAGIFSLVPIFGSIASTIPIVLVALTTSPLTGFFSLLWIVGIHILEANFLNPKIMGNSAKIHPVLIVLSLLFGEYYYGIIGALLAVPIMSIIITVFLSVLGRARSIDEGVFKSTTR